LENKEAREEEKQTVCRNGREKVERMERKISRIRAKNIRKRLLSSVRVGGWTDKVTNIYRIFN
jgi:hypothetical protein